MSKRTIRIASVANNLFLENRIRDAGIIKDIWDLITRKKPKLHDKISESSRDLRKYLVESHKIDFIQKKLELVRNSKSLIKALDFLITKTKEIKGAESEITNVESFKDLIQEASDLLNPKEMNIFSKSIAYALLGNPIQASIITSGTTEPLDEDDDSVEDGVTSEPLEDHEED